jgi:Na+/H+ antiporter NhaD/arsenite permease-like protein
MGPLLGSLITEPAAMVICAAVLSRKVLDLSPGAAFRYATLGLLFVDISVGGTLTSFAAPPVLMVAKRWGWDTPFMLTHFGWKAVVGIVVSNALYLAAFWGEFRALATRAAERSTDEGREGPHVPPWIVAVHLAFLALTVFTAHTPGVFVGGFLFFLAFQSVTAPHQRRMDLQPPLLVGFFLAGLVVHGAGQTWWIAPVLARLDALPLFVGATLLTAFNDNAAITYLASLVPGFSPALQYAVVAGAVTGGGLTVIANAPNPAGQAALARHFPNGVSPVRLLLGASVPTLVMAGCFLLL